MALFHVDQFRGNPMTEIAAQAADALPEMRALVDMEDPAALLVLGGRTGGLPEVAPGVAAMIQYTSGTTGFP